jgi:hypothetical protein
MVQRSLVSVLGALAMASLDLPITLKRYVGPGVLAILLTGVLVGLLIPPSRCQHFTRPAYRALRFQVVDESRGGPISGARVTLLHPYDPEEPPVEVATEGEGLAEIRGRFTQSGSLDAQGEPQGVIFSYRPWCVTVQAVGFRDYRAALDDYDPTNESSHQPLRLDDPAPTPILIRMERLVSQGQ